MSACLLRSTCLFLVIALVVLGSPTARNLGPSDSIEESVTSVDVQDLAPSFRNLSSKAYCFRPPAVKTFQIDPGACRKVQNAMWMTADAAQTRIYDSRQNDWEFGLTDVPCVIGLHAYQPRKVDLFSLNQIANRASLILTQCKDQLYGGEMGMKSRGQPWRGFVVRVSGRQPDTMGRNNTAMS